MKFKIGDEVKVVADKARLKECCIESYSLTGKTGIIRSRDTGSDLLYQIEIDTNTWYLAEQDLELVEQPEVVDTKLYGHPRFYEILKAMAELHSQKNHDYAGTSNPLKNLRACTRLDLEPFMGVLVRLQDKWSRLEEFVKSGKLMVKGESIKDTLMDNAVYSILAIILYEEQEKDYDAAIDHEIGEDRDRTTPVPGGY